MKLLSIVLCHILTICSCISTIPILGFPVRKTSLFSNVGLLIPVKSMGHEKPPVIITELQTSIRGIVIEKTLQIRGGAGSVAPLLESIRRDINSIILFSKRSVKGLSGWQKNVKIWLTKLPPPVRVCLIANIVVWLLWQVSEDYMKKNFTECKENLSKLRLWTYITHAFSHSSLFHLFFNMSFLVTVGVPVAKKLSGLEFLGVVFGSAVISGVATALARPIHRILHSIRKTLFFRKSLFVAVPDSINRMSLGFSGVNSALLFLFAALYPNTKLVFFGFGADSAVVAPTALQHLYLIDLVVFVFELLTGVCSPLAHEAHLGGYLAGAVAKRVLMKRSRGRFLVPRLFI